MLVSDRPELIAQAKHLASQGRDPAPHYEHSQLAYNYRMSNVLAAIGRGQLRRLSERVCQRRRNFGRYRAALEAVPGLSFMPEPTYGLSTRWLTALQIDPKEFGATREEVRLRLEAADIEARPVWKPMHLQPLFASCARVGGEVAERLFERGLCLPSGSQMTEADIARVVEIVLDARKKR